jgi:hypothetical protein
MAVPDLRAEDVARCDRSQVRSPLKGMADAIAATKIVERRKYARIMLKGTVIIVAGEHTHHGRIANLSEGGLLALTQVKLPSANLGRRGELELRLDDQKASWTAVSGRVLRIGGDRVALAFDAVPATLLRLIDEMTLASRLRLRVLSVVLVDENTERRTRLADGFRDVGCGVIEASTSLEAIVRLGESSFEPDLIAVSDTVMANHAAELRAFVGNEHADVKLVVIGHDSEAPSGIAIWLSSRDPDSDLARRIRDVLALPRLRR